MPAGSPRMIFVNLPVTDLARARTFYEAIGFTNVPHFTDETAAGMAWSDTIKLMLLTHAKWSTFTTRPIPPATHSEVAFALSCDSRAEVDDRAEAGGRAGGALDLNPPEEHAFMVQRTIADPDGHVWEFTWMDPAFASGEMGPEAAA